MRIVLITYYYPPAPTVGSFRAGKVARAFLDAGHQVDVITIPLPGDAPRVETPEPGLTIHYLRLGVSARERLARFKRRLRDGEAPAPAADRQVGGVPDEVIRSVPGWKRILFSLLWVPDDRQGFIRPAARLGRSLVQAGAELVYTTAPPFSDHLAGLLIKRRAGARWVAEFRDPWIENPNRPAHIRSGIADRLNAWLERQTLRRADHVVAVSESTGQLLAGKLPLAVRGKVLVALNGIDHPAEAVPQRNGTFRIVHAGSLYQDRDPRPFLIGLSQFVRREGLAPDAVRVDFVGDCRYFQGISLPDFAREQGVGELVHFSDWVPQHEARRMTREADLLLLLFQNSPQQIANKLYDYLAARRPILAFVDAAGEVERMLSRVGGHYVISSPDPGECERALADAWRSRGSSAWTTNEGLLAEWSTGSQMRRLLAALAIPRRGV